MSVRSWFKQRPAEVAAEKASCLQETDFAFLAHPGSYAGHPWAFAVPGQWMEVFRDVELRGDRGPEVCPHLLPELDDSPRGQIWANDRQRFHPSH